MSFARDLGIAGAILPDGCRVNAETVDGMTTFRYREFFRKKEYFGMEREMLITRTIYSLEPLLESYNVKITRGEGWVEVSGKVQRDIFAMMMIGEFSHWSHDDMVEAMGRSSKKRVRDGVKGRSHRPKVPLTEGEKTLSDAMLKVLASEPANQVANVGQLIPVRRCPLDCGRDEHTGPCGR